MQTSGEAPCNLSRNDRHVRWRKYQRQRVVAGMWTVVVALALVNYFHGLGAAHAYSKTLLAVTLLAGSIWMHFFGPTMRDVRVHRRLKRWRENAAQRELDEGAKY